MPRHKEHLSVALLRCFGAGIAACGWLFTANSALAQSFQDTEQDFIHGKYDAVIKVASQKVADHDYDPSWRLLLEKTLLMVGRYPEAHRTALEGVVERTETVEKCLLLHQTFLFANDPGNAARQLTELKALVEQRFPTFQGNEPVHLGEALLLLGVEPRLVLDNCYRPAEQTSDFGRDAFVATGQLALDKHDFALAADTFRAGLEKYAGDPDLECGLAQALEPSDRASMLEAIQAALNANPNHIPTLLLLADHMIDAEQYDLAETQLNAVLKINPHQPAALAYRAVMAHLKNDDAGEAKYRSDALEFWKTNPEVDYLIGLKLGQKYQFVEAAAAERQAVRSDSSYLPAKRELAQDLLRLGQSDEGWKLAEEVHAKDNYDVGAYNMVTLHDEMKKFKTLTNADFTVHMEAHEAALYGDGVLDLLGKAKATLCQKYGLTLTDRTTVDIFTDQKDFGVRTLGIPDNPGYLGVCFGSVITANSPASEAPNPANWHDVLWHEFCHVVTLQLTRNRMPRWLSEGISVYEERQANPAWGERMNLSYRKMAQGGALTPISELSSAFLQPKNGEYLQFAYFESSMVVEMIVQQYGFDSLKQILTDLGAGKEINAAISAHTCPMPKLEEQFTAYVKSNADNLAPMADLSGPTDGTNKSGTAQLMAPPSRGTILLDSDAPTPDKAAWAKAHPTNYFVLLDKARHLMSDEKWSEARPILETLAGQYHGERGGGNPLWLEAVTDRNLNDTNAELGDLQKFSAVDTDSVDLDQRLIEIYEGRQDWPSVAKTARALLEINPLIAAPYTALAKAGDATGQGADSIEAYRKLLLLDPPDTAEVHFQLARLLHARGDSEKEAKRHILQALEDAPRFREAQRLLMEIEHGKSGSS